MSQNGLKEISGCPGFGGACFNPLASANFEIASMSEAEAWYSLSTQLTQDSTIPTNYPSYYHPRFLIPPPEQAPYHPGTVHCLQLVEVVGSLIEMPGYNPHCYC